MKAHIPHGFSPREWRECCGEATALLQALLRIDTTNPPGNEEAAALLLQQSLAADGLSAELIAAEPGRTNLICRTGSPSPAGNLLLTGHLDVVPAGDEAVWTHPPFGGVLAEGMIWGRGALDMKHMVAMCTVVLKLLARREVPLNREIILAAVADEEAGCSLGSRFLVEQHPDKVRAALALGEFGGFPIEVRGKRYLMVQTAEKGTCHLRLTASGPAGHGSVPHPDSAILRLCRALTRLEEAGLPRHPAPVTEDFVHLVGAHQPLLVRKLLGQVLDPRWGDAMIAKVFGDKHQAASMRAMLHDTAAVTTLRAGQKDNVIPATAVAEIDARMLPGVSAEELMGEIRELLPEEHLSLELVSEHRGTMNHPHDSPLWDAIRAAAKRYDPELAVVPYMLPGFTDGGHFSKLGARWYGFSPVWSDPAGELKVSAMPHAIDERIPEDGFHWGLAMLLEVVTSLCAA